MEFSSLGKIWDAESPEDAVKILKEIPSHRNSMGNGIGVIIDGDEIPIITFGEPEDISIYGSELAEKLKVPLAKTMELMGIAM